MTVYSRTRRGAIGAALSLLVLAGIAESEGGRGWAISLAVLGIVGALFSARRPRLSADASGVTVVNMVRSHRVPWAEITGFAREWYGGTRCLLIGRRDGRSVRAWVDTDDAVVAELRDRLATMAGTRDTGVDQMRVGRFANAFPSALWVILCLFFVGLGVVTAVNATSDLPKTYARLRAHGVRATAQFAGCHTLLRDTRCRLTLVYEGRRRTWDYGEDYPQFRGLPVGAPVPVLVDPDHSGTVYTVRDVERRTNAGFGVLAIFGIVLAVVGVVGLTWFWRLKRRTAVLKRAFA